KVKEKEKEFYHEQIEVIVEEFIDGKLYGVPFIKKTDDEFIIGTPHFSTSDKKGNIVTTHQKRRAEGGMKIEISVDEALNKELIDLSRRYFKNM
ncbi:hypothetical protein, partial [Streptococcus suis]